MTKIWAIADPHLSFGIQGKSMEVFGPAWKQFTQKLETNWRAHIGDDDLVLIPGDISWAMTLGDALPDLNWIAALPGRKIISRGNHDYWWPSNAKLAAALPPSIDFINNNALTWNGVSIGGARLWDTPEYNFNDYIEFRDNPRAKEKEPDPEKDVKIFQREVDRLRRSLAEMPPAAIRIAMVHYPPIGPDLAPSTVSTLLESFGITHCVFGHLHNVRPGSLPFGEKNGVRYLFTACDYTEFKPVEVIDLSS